MSGWTAHCLVRGSTLEVEADDGGIRVSAAGREVGLLEKRIMVDPTPVNDGWLVVDAEGLTIAWCADEAAARLVAHALDALDHTRRELP